MGAIEDHRITTRVAGYETDAASVIADNLDIWTSAIKHKSGAGRGGGSKRELYGIKKLRELILELAVRGLLVPQDPNDAPASELLKKIAADKVELIKDGKVKKQKLLPPIDDEEKPFSLPNGWGWVRLGEIASIVRGVTYKKADAAYTPSRRTVPLMRANNIGRDLNFDNLIYIPEELVKQEQLIVGGDILIAMSSGSSDLVGKAAQAKDDLQKTFGAFCGVVRSFSSDMFTYFNFFFQTPLYRRQAKESGKGIGIQNLNQGALTLLLVPVPAAQEREKIVAKVDELMALCDQLEQQTETSLTAHETLVEALLGALTNATDHAGFQQAWQRIAHHFDTLFTTEHSIDQLKQSILQLAVMGKLVPQNPNDEPASELLKKIATEKSRLVKEGNIKKQKALPPISHEQKPFDLPAGWNWTQLLQISNEIGTGPFGSMIHKSDYIAGGTPLINPSHMINDRIVENSKISIGPSKAEKLSSYRLTSGDIVLARRGEVGRCAIVTDREEGWLCGTGSFYLKLSSAISRRYMALVFKVESTRNYLTGKAVGTTMINLNHGILNKLPVALPPLGEQERIVAKTDELIALCDQLKARLNEAQKTQLQLADAISEQALA